MIVSFFHTTIPARRIGILVALCILMVSCDNKQSKPPVPVEKMRAVTMDLHTAEYYSQYVKTVSGYHALEKNTDSLAIYYVAILKHHKMSLAEYQEAMDWYIQHPKFLDSLYSEMITRASELKAKYPDEDKHKARPVQQDSSAQDPPANSSRQNDSVFASKDNP